TKKAISPRGFVAVLEGAFGQTVNRQQQDAQEFLQLLVERLQDEYNAGKRARVQSRRELSRSQGRNGELSKSQGRNGAAAHDNGAPTIHITSDQSDETSDEAKLE